MLVEAALNGVVDDVALDGALLDAALGVVTFEMAPAVSLNCATCMADIA